MGTIPLAQNAIKREKEIRLRETLRMVRSAIDEFKRDTAGACPQGAITSSNPTNRFQQATTVFDPRSRVVVDDCTIFTADNLDRYPPALDTLVDGVSVRQRGISLSGGSGMTKESVQASELNNQDEVKKVYLREMPIDPMTGKPDWKIRSSYQDKDSDSWDEINVFDIRSSSSEEALNGEKYSAW
jgi:general secretion pathway protein G